VALTADGDGINEDILDSLEGADYDKAGRKIGDDLGNAFGKRVRKNLREHMRGFNKDFDEVVKRMGKAVEDDRTIRDGIRWQLTDAFTSGHLDPLADEIGRRFGRRFGPRFKHEVEDSMLSAIREVMEKAARDGNSFDFSDIVRKINTTGVGDIDTLGPVMERTLRDLERKQAAYLRDWDEALREQSRRDAEYAKDYERFWTVALRDRDAEVKKFNKMWADAHAENLKRQKRAEDALWKVRRATAKAYNKYLIDLERGRIDEFGVEVSRNRGLGGRGRGPGDTIGRMLGAGSRNNALNLIGRSIGNIINLTARVQRGVSSMFRQFTIGFRMAGENASFFQRILGGVSRVGSQAAAGVAGAFRALLVALPAVASGMVIVIAVASALVSAISALVALVTALASTIMGALAAALTVGAGLFLALAAAAGLAAIAVVSMTDKQKKAFTDAFKPLGDLVKKIGQEMVTDLMEVTDSFTIWADNIKSGLELLIPAAERMGTAFGRAGNIITASFSGSGFALFADAMKRFLPTITVNMSKALGSFLNGVAGMFAAVMPQVTRFSKYLSDLTARFSEWANSAKGQTAIQDFVKRSVESFQSLWDFVREFVGFVMDVLFDPATQEAGNSMFDSLADSFEGFRKAVERASKNGDLKRWFDNAIEFGSALKDVIIALKNTFKTLDNSGVLDAVSDGIRKFANFIDTANSFLKPLMRYLKKAMPKALEVLETAIGTVNPILGNLADAFGVIEGAADKAVGAIRVLYDLIKSPPSFNPPKVGGGGGGGGGGSWGSDGGTERRGVLGISMSADEPTKADAVAALQRTERTATWTIKAMLATFDKAMAKANKGRKKDDKKFVNPLREWARKLIDEGPGLVARLRQAMRQVNKEIAAAMKEAASGENLGAVRSGLQDTIRSIRETARSSVDDAQSALNNAANRLISADSRKEVANALKAIKRAQKNLNTALRDQKKIKAAADLLAKQKVTTDSTVADLVAGLKRQDATLADYVRARKRIAKMLEDANAKLTEAMNLHDTYRTQVADSIKAFGDLTTAQAQVIDGVEQALTSADIVGNLETRLAQVRKFQDDLRALLALGLSNDAYKQIVDKGVEGGAAYAAALLEGGSDAIGSVNSLVASIGEAADTLGLDTSDRLYKAGVDMAQGIVDGLESLADQVDAAATRLGDSIAAAVAKSLGIKSPSTRLFAMMGSVGDGAVLGLDAQHGKVATAAQRFADQIAVSPEVAAYAAGQRSGVSGNSTGGDSRFRDLIVQTPTENPEAVAWEVLAELTGRL